MPDAFKALRQQSATGFPIEPKVLRNIYKDRNGTEPFIAHCLAVFTVYDKLHALYGERIAFFTKNELNRPQYAYFPRPLPDAFISIESDTTYYRKRTKDFFLEVVDEYKPFFVIARRIKQHIDYAEEGGWASSRMPKVLIVCETKSLQRGIQKQIRKSLRGAYDHVTFYTIAMETLNRWEHPEEELWLMSDWHEEASELRSIA